MELKDKKTIKVWCVSCGSSTLVNKSIIRKYDTLLQKPGCSSCFDEPASFAINKDTAIMYIKATIRRYEEALKKVKKR